MSIATMKYRNILITGAAAGIGRSIAETFSQHSDCRLILLDNNLDALREWTSTSSMQSKCEIHKVDISNLGRLQEFFNVLQREIDYLHVLVNCAGICDENEPEDLDTWRRVIDVNLNGTFNVTALSLSLLATGGRIINMASILGRAGKVRNTAYCASKHAIVGMTKALALDLASRKITVNAILPAWIDTPMLQRELATQASTAGLGIEEIQRNAKRKLPQRRFIESSEIAALVTFLCGEDARGITAQSLIVDGGVGLGM